MEINVNQAIDQRGLGKRQIAVLIFAFLITLVDGMDMQMLVFAAPVIVEEWNISTADLAVALAATVIGMAIGAAGGGFLGDRYGRKRTLLASTAVFGLATLAVAAVTDMTSLVVLRFIGGLGFGAATPTAYGLGIEALPHRSRTWASVLLSLANAAGGMVGALLALAILPRFGWPAAFVVSAVITGAIGLAIWIVVPESPGFLLAKGRHDDALASLRWLIGDALPPSTRLALPDTSPSRSHLSGVVFTRPYLRTTFGSWLSYFMTALATFALLSWLPILLRQSGWSLEESVHAGFIFNLSAIIGSLAAAVITPRSGSKAIVIVAAVGLIAGLALLPSLIPGAGNDHPPVLALTVAIGLAGCGCGILFSVGLAIVGQAYPLDSRARGVGFALSSSRFGAVAATLAGGALLAFTDENLTIFFGGLCLVAFLCIVGALVIDRHIEPKRAAVGG